MEDDQFSISQSEPGPEEIININTMKLWSLKKGNFTDCVFLVGPIGKQEKVNAVKAMLMMCSPYMKGLFRNRSESPIVIEHIDPHIFKLMIEFIHLGQLVTPMNCNEVADLVVAADHFLVESLKFVCKGLLLEKIGVDLLWPVLDKILKVNLEDVADFACSYILSTETEDCLEDPLFLTASTDSIKFLLRLKSLDLDDEWELVEYCRKWAENQKDPRKLFRQIVGGLHLASLSSEQIVQIAEYFTSKECIALYKFGITKEKSEHFPSCILDTERIFRPPPSPEEKEDDGKLKECGAMLIPDSLFTGDKFVTSESITNVLCFTPNVNIHVCRFDIVCQVHGYKDINYVNQISGYKATTQKEDYVLNFKMIFNNDDSTTISWTVKNTKYAAIRERCYMIKPVLCKRGQKFTISLVVSVTSESFFPNISCIDVNSSIEKKMDSKIFKKMYFEGSKGVPIVLRKIYYIID